MRTKVRMKIVVKVSSCKCGKSCYLRPICTCVYDRRVWHGVGMKGRGGEAAGEF